MVQQSSSKSFKDKAMLALAVKTAEVHLTMTPEDKIREGLLAMHGLLEVLLDDDVSEEDLYLAYQKGVSLIETKTRSK